MFDRSGDQIRHVGGAEAAEREVAPGRVAERIDLVEHRLGEPGAGWPGLPVEEFAFQRCEERLRDRVIKCVADSAHRAGQTGTAKSLTEYPAAVVRAVGRYERLGAQVISDRTTDHTTWTRVEHHLRIDQSPARAVLDVILHPQMVGAARTELAVNQIFRKWIGSTSTRAAPQTQSGSPDDASTLKTPIRGRSS